jgi:16S rRNA (adenine1518-N6/adenine1519-N6)-dimethyltransferase
MGAYSRLVKANAPGAKKRFGQHFLRDTGVIDRIVRWIHPAPNDVFLEIGAGDGALSCRLASRVSRLMAVEIDSDRVKPLEESLRPFSSAIVIPGDFLRMDLSELVVQHMQSDQQLRIAGNLPYNIATAIIEKLLHDHRTPILDMFFMVQLEVAQRITASPGSRQYGFLSVNCQHYADVEMGFKVSPACFVPRPKVTSAMVSIRPKSMKPDPIFESDFDSIAKAAFSYRRKTLSNALMRHPIFESVCHDLLIRAGIDGSRRAEDLSVLEYECLASIYHREFRDKESGVRIVGSRQSIVGDV